MNRSPEYNNQYRWYFDKVIKYSNERKPECLSELEGSTIDKAKHLMELFEKNKRFNQNYNKDKNQFPLLTAGHFYSRTIQDQEKVDIIRCDDLEKESLQDSYFSYE